MQFNVTSDPVTGEELVTRHSLRGAAESRMVWSEQAILSIKNSTPPPRTTLAPEVLWNRVALPAMHAGHHPLSAIKYYLSMWPVFFYAINYQCKFILGQDLVLPGLFPE